MVSHDEIASFIASRLKRHPRVAVVTRKRTNAHAPDVCAVLHDGSIVKVDVWMDLSDDAFGVDQS